jgi:hypothetical protein
MKAPIILPRTSLASEFNDLVHCDAMNLTIIEKFLDDTIAGKWTITAPNEKGQLDAIVGSEIWPRLPMRGGRF